jgi:hypothetical protein
MLKILGRQALALAQGNPEAVTVAQITQTDRRRTQTMMAN